MKKGMILLSSAAGLVLLVLMSGCGGGIPPYINDPYPPTPPSLTVLPSVSHLGSGESLQFTATVRNASNTAVTWSIANCISACGTISETGMYTAPALIAERSPIMVKATLLANATVWNGVDFMLMPVSISLSPNTPANVLPGGTRSFAALLDHDPQHAGVAWTLSGDGCSAEACGALANMTPTTVVYQAPSTAPSAVTVMLKATSTTDPNQSNWVSMTVSDAPVRLQGKYALLINGVGGDDSDGYSDETVAGHVDLDGDGTLTGVWDANRSSGIYQAQAITGNYNIQPDGFGSMTLNAGGSSWTYIVTLDSDSTFARLAEAGNSLDCTFCTGSGYLVKQDPQYFNLSAVQGDRVLATRYGTEVVLGRFTADAQAVIGSGIADFISLARSSFASSTVSGSFAAPDPFSGRGTASLTFDPGILTPGRGPAYEFAYYVVSDRALLLVQTNTAGGQKLSGEIRHQNGAGTFSNASLDSPSIAAVEGEDFWWGPEVGIMRIVPDGAGALTSTSHWTEDTTMSGSYSVTADGRVALNLPQFGTLTPLKGIAYLIDQNTGYILCEGFSSFPAGSLAPQSGGPFSIQSLAGKFFINSGVTSHGYSGWITLNQDSTATGTIYFNEGTGASPYKLTGTVTVTPEGRATAVLDPNPLFGDQEVVFWAISPDHGVAMTYGTLLYIDRADAH